MPTKNLGLILLCFGFCLAELAWAVDTSRLWLPRSKWFLKDDLTLAAERAALTDRCAEVLSGRWLESAGSAEQPVLIIICRDSITGRSYYRKYARVGPLRLQLLEEQGRSMPSREIAKPIDANKSADVAQTPAVDVEDLPTVAQLDAAEIAEQEAEAKAQAAQLASEAGDLPSGVLPPAELDAAEEVPIPLEDRVWARCFGALEQKTMLMLGVKIHQEPRPEFREDGLGGGAYTIDFDAENPRGDALYYRAQCELSAEDEVSLRLRPRPRPAE